MDRRFESPLLQQRVNANRRYRSRFLRRAPLQFCAGEACHHGDIDRFRVLIEVLRHQLVSVSEIGHLGG